MRYLEHRVPPPIVGALVAAAMWAVASIGPVVPLSPVVASATAVAVALMGLVFDVLGLLAFRAHRTTVNPLRPERASALVTRGIYRVTRNPMYVGMAFLLLAWAIHLRAGVAFAGPVLFVAYLTRFQIVPEERVLRERFGEAFAAYAARVRRWL